MAAADQRVVASTVLSQVNSEDLRIIFRLFSDDAQQIVRRAVVDGNDLISKIRPFRDDLTNFIYDESYGPFAGLLFSCKIGKNCIDHPAAVFGAEAVVHRQSGQAVALGGSINVLSAEAPEASAGR